MGVKGVIIQAAFYYMAIIVTVNEIGLASNEKAKCNAWSFDKNGLWQSCTNQNLHGTIWRKMLFNNYSVYFLECVNTISSPRLNSSLKMRLSFNTHGYLKICMIKVKM